MRQAIHQARVETHGKGLTDITLAAEDFVRDTGIEAGLLTVFCLHTSASLLIQENADPDVRTDLCDFFEKIAPEDGSYVHDSEGSDDMPAHLRAALTQSHLSIPIVDGSMAIGTWQGIYLFEHRRAPHRRTVVMHIIGD